MPLELASFIVDGAPIVDCCREVVDNLHHTHRIPTQVEVLLRFVINVPLKLLELVDCVFLPLSKNVKEEVEEHSTITAFASVFISFQPHDFEVIQIGFLL